MFYVISQRTALKIMHMHTSTLLHSLAIMSYIQLVILSLSTVCVCVVAWDLSVSLMEIGELALIRTSPRFAYGQQGRCIHNRSLLQGPLY